MIFLYLALLALLALPITWLVSLVIVSFSAKVSAMKWDGLLLTYCAILAIISLPAIYGIYGRICYTPLCQ